MQANGQAMLHNMYIMERQQVKAPGMSGCLPKLRPTMQCHVGLYFCKEGKERA